jgi:pilus assembly protein CpaE
MPGVQVIAAGSSCDPQSLMTLMRAGIREFVASPFDPRVLLECIGRAADNLRRRPVDLQATEFVYAFLPAKPGVGSSSLAVNASLAIAQRHPDDALLADFDLNSGIIRFLLKLTGDHSVLDAAERAQTLDDDIWANLVSKAGQLDVLPSAILEQDVRLQALHLRELVEYARRKYRVVSFDLSGNLEKYSLELMHESRRIFLVTTTEVCSLHLAREKIQYLRRMDLGDRISVLLNRYHKRHSIDPADVESVLGAPVLMKFSNEYARLNRAIAEGKAVDPTCELGKQCAALADFMLETKPAVPNTKRRFVEYFAISPARLAVESRKS